MVIVVERNAFAEVPQGQAPVYARTVNTIHVCITPRRYFQRKVEERKHGVGSGT